MSVNVEYAVDGLLITIYLNMITFLFETMLRIYNVLYI